MEEECGPLKHDLKVGCAALARCVPGGLVVVHRLALQDPNFRDICEDYGTALGAVEAHSSNTPSETNNAEEFRHIAEELLAEALSYVADNIEPGAH